MKKLGVKLPLTRDTSDGFTMLHNIAQMYRQNLKMLILTNPGERVMEPNFGVGMNRFLFESYGSAVRTQIEEKIQSQVSIYIPNIQILSMDFGESQDAGMLTIKIKYNITNLGMADSLAITI